MSADLDLYRSMEQKLRRIRIRNHGKYVPHDEQPLLSDMDEVWDRLTPEDIKALTTPKVQS